MTLYHGNTHHQHETEGNGSSIPQHDQRSDIVNDGGRHEHRAYDSLLQIMRVLGRRENSQSRAFATVSRYRLLLVRPSPNDVADKEAPTIKVSTAP